MPWQGGQKFSDKNYLENFILGQKIFILGQKLTENQAKSAKELMEIVLKSRVRFW